MSRIGSHVRLLRTAFLLVALPAICLVGGCSNEDDAAGVKAGDLLTAQDLEAFYGVPFEVVPGITAAFAAAAAIPCSLTDRNAASNVIFSTGHHAQSHNDAAIPEIEDSTRIVYMPGRDLTLLALQWLQEGLPSEFPCAIVSHAARPEQQVQRTTLGELGNARATSSPSLLIAGWALQCSPDSALTRLADRELSA